MENDITIMLNKENDIRMMLNKENDIRMMLIKVKMKLTNERMMLECH